MATDTNGVPLWGRVDLSFESSRQYGNAVQDASLRAVFTGPSGQTIAVGGFWDGERSWRVRFKPTAQGTWKWRTECTDASNVGLHGQGGRFECVAPASDHIFAARGPVVVSADARYFAHADGTPFFWLGDTAWDGPLLSSDAEWAHYLKVRVEQGFNTVQWMATQNRAAPDGDALGRWAYRRYRPNSNGGPATAGASAWNPHERIEVVPEFFQRLDKKVDAINAAGMLSAPVLLWAHPGTLYQDSNPGFALPESQAILLAKYMVARWQANDVVWFLPGDWNYSGQNAEKWKRIGRAVFGETPGAPVGIHPMSRSLYYDEFRYESWMTVLGYQSGHYTDDKSLSWIFDGPCTEHWQDEPRKVFINLEPPYEYHIPHGSNERITAFHVRRASYWSLLNAPPAGLTYGGHGVWGWDDGTKAPVDHPHTGVPLPLKKALGMPGARHMGILKGIFDEIEWWKLRPHVKIITDQPALIAEHISTARSDAGDLGVIYSPSSTAFTADLTGMLAGRLNGTWISPQSGERFKQAVPSTDRARVRLEPPGYDDWLLVIKAESK